MKCVYCNHMNSDDAQYCKKCGKPLSYDKKPWHSLHKLLWGNNINQDILETLNDLK
ncbi:MAG: zinc-ribbon domain-containing protein [Methanothermobacter sp.]